MGKYAFKTSNKYSPLQSPNGNYRKRRTGPLKDNTNNETEPLSNQKVTGPACTKSVAPTEKRARGRKSLNGQTRAVSPTKTQNTEGRNSYRKKALKATREVFQVPNVIKKCIASTKRRIARITKKVKYYIELPRRLKKAEAKLSELRGELLELQATILKLESTDKALQPSIPIEYEKYDKMRKMGVPNDGVKHAILKDGLDPTVLFPENQTENDMPSPQVNKRKTSKKEPQLSDENANVTSKRSKVTASDLSSVNLRKTRSATALEIEHSNAEAVFEKSISQADITNVKLRKKMTNPNQADKENTPRNRRATLSTTDLMAVKLRPTNGDRSPGRTPLKEREKSRRKSIHECSPFPSLSNAEYLEYALKRKFANVNFTPGSQLGALSDSDEA